MKAAWIASLLLITPIWLSCAHETTVTTTTSACVEPYHSDSHNSDNSDNSYNSYNSYNYDVDDRGCERVVEEVVVKTERDACHGLISCAFVVVGEVIALPFKIVGAAFDVVL